MPGQKNRGDTNLTERQVYGIIAKVTEFRNNNQRINISSIARDFNCSRFSVTSVIRRDTLVLPLVPKTRNKSRTSVSDEDEVNIMELINADPKLAATTIKQILDLACSVSTVRNILKAGDRKSYRACIKEKLTDQHKRNRLLWAQQNVDRIWDNIIFSDESCVTSNEHGELRVRRPLGTRYDERYITSIRNSGRTSVCIWAYMTNNGLSGLVRIQGRLTGDGYVRILQQNILPYLRNNPNTLFQQDFSPIHTSRVATAFYNEHNINLLPWCPKMQDLNPMENIWAMLKAQGPWDNVVRTSDDLWDRISTAWQRLQDNDAVVQPFYDSMPRRVQEIINKNGGMTKY